MLLDSRGSPLPPTSSNSAKRSSQRRPTTSQNIKPPNASGSLSSSFAGLAIGKNNSGIKSTPKIGKYSRTEALKRLAEYRHRYANEEVRPFLSHLKATYRQAAGGTSAPGSSRLDRGQGRNTQPLGGSFNRGGPSTPPSLPIPITTQYEAIQLADFNPNYISGIRIYKIRSNGQPHALEAGDPWFDIMAAAIMMGLDFVDRRAPGFSRMMVCGESILDAIDNNPDAPPLPVGRHNTPEWVRTYALDFISRVRNDFPVVIIHDLKEQTARTKKADWSSRGPFNPQMAATIEVNSRFIERIEGQRRAFISSSSAGDTSANYHRLRYQTMLARLGITTAHELEHVFTGYLLKDPDWHTPPASFPSTLCDIGTRRIHGISLSLTTLLHREYRLPGGREIVVSGSLAGSWS